MYPLSIDQCTSHRFRKFLSSATQPARRCCSSEPFSSSKQGGLLVFLPSARKFRQVARTSVFVEFLTHVESVLLSHLPFRLSPSVIGILPELTHQRFSQRNQCSSEVFNGPGFHFRSRRRLYLQNGHKGGVIDHAALIVFASLRHSLSFFIANF